MLELQKTVRATDLAIAAGRRRQSPRTGFVHVFHGDAAASDTIPIFENACFALALFSEKKAETVLEGRDLILRLLEFQTAEGNFPTYLHDFPRAYDGLMGLKVAPVLLRLLRDYGSVLGVDAKQKIETALAKILAFSETRRLPPIWEHRYRVLRSEVPAPLDTSRFSPADWWDYVVARQFLETPCCLAVHPELGVFVGGTSGEEQEGLEPAPQCIEYLATESFTPRLLKDHVRQLQLALIKEVETGVCGEIEGWHSVHTTDSSLMAAHTADASMEHAFRFLWAGTTVHSLVVPTGSWVYRDNTLFLDLAPPAEVSRNDLFEVALYTDASPETTLLVNGVRATVFSLGQEVSIVTPQRTVSVKIELVHGDGVFCGHLFRGNRPCQTSLSGPFAHAAFDWKIALRTLRRQGACQLRVCIA